MKENKKIAIIFFSLDAKKEAEIKNFCISRKSSNEKISAALIAETQQTLQSIDLPIFHYHQDNQTGNNFGEKLANAYQEVCDLGYDAVISVGNDSPEINQLNWSHITERLQQGENVIGPDLRGGTYLIGVNKKQFNKASFASLPWQSAKLIKSLINYFEFEASTPRLLDKIRDINTIHDLKLLIKKSESFKNLSQLVKLVFSLNILKYLKQAINYQSFLALPGAPFRAPPQFS